MKKHMLVYMFGMDYAVKHNEVEKYNASLQLNIKCRDAIRESIDTHYQNNRLDEAAVHEVIEQFGYDRTMAILANTVINHGWDRRYSSSNHKWAQEYNLPWCMLGENCYKFMLSTTHPGLVDLFLTQVRQEYERSFQRPSVKAALKEQTSQVKEPIKPHKPKEQSL